MNFSERPGPAEFVHTQQDRGCCCLPSYASHQPETENPGHRLDSTLLGLTAGTQP